MNSGGVTTDAVLQNVNLQNTHSFMENAKLDDLEKHQTEHHLTRIIQYENRYSIQYQAYTQNC